MRERIILVILILIGALASACSPFARQPDNNELPTAASTGMVTSSSPTSVPPAPSAALAPTSVVSKATAVPTMPKPTATSPSSEAGDTPKRISLPPGGTTATIQGNLAANGIDRYVLRALAGQTMRIDVSSAQAHMLLQINGADGNVFKTFGAGGSHWGMLLPTTQDYNIAIATEDSSRASYTLTVTIPPRP